MKSGGCRLVTFCLEGRGGGGAVVQRPMRWVPLPFGAAIQASLKHGFSQVPQSAPRSGGWLGHAGGMDWKGNLQVYVVPEGGSRRRWISVKDWLSRAAPAAPPVQGDEPGGKRQREGGKDGDADVEEISSSTDGDGGDHDFRPGEGPRPATRSGGGRTPTTPTAQGMPPPKSRGGKKTPKPSLETIPLASMGRTPGVGGGEAGGSGMVQRVVARVGEGGVRRDAKGKGKGKASARVVVGSRGECRYTPPVPSMEPWEVHARLDHRGADRNRSCRGILRDLLGVVARHGVGKELWGHVAMDKLPPGIVLQPAMFGPDEETPGLPPSPLSTHTMPGAGAEEPEFVEVDPADLSADEAAELSQLEPQLERAVKMAYSIGMTEDDLALDDAVKVHVSKLKRREEVVRLRRRRLELLKRRKSDWDAVLLRRSLGGADLGPPPPPVSQALIPLPSVTSGLIALPRYFETRPVSPAPSAVPGAVGNGGGEGGNGDNGGGDGVGTVGGDGGGNGATDGEGDGRAIQGQGDPGQGDGEGGVGV